MSDKCKLITAYNEHIMTTYDLLFDDNPNTYPDSLKPYFTDDVVLSEPDSLPWGGLWHGREGFAGEAKAHSAAFTGKYRFELVTESFLAAGESTVYHNFEFNIVKLDDPGRVYNWLGVERYDFTGDKCSYLDVYYKDPTGMMKFLGVAP